MTIPVKPINEIEVKSEVSINDKILILDSVSEEARLASKDELKGEPGTPGTPGKDGEDGAAATVTVGIVSTLPAGSSATVTNSGTSSAAVLDFGIPKGATGAAGADGKDGTDGKDGKDGTDGAAATITVGTTTTLPAGSSATVENVGTSQDAILNFGIPEGDSGSGDVNGPASSTDDHIVTFDGTTGKLIQDSGISVSALNTQTFTLSSTSDLTTAQAAYDWYLAGKNPIVYYNRAYNLLGVSSGKIYFSCDYISKTDQSKYSDLQSKNINFTISDGTITAINTTHSNYEEGVRVLATNVNYSTPYTPTYNGSPATKKYVDDNVIQKGSTAPANPTEGMAWYDTTNDELKVYDGSQWTGIGGGDVLVSSQANNILTSGMKIWAGTETDYTNLGMYDSNTLYLTVE